MGKICKKCLTREKNLTSEFFFPPTWLENPLSGCECTTHSTVQQAVLRSIQVVYTLGWSYATPGPPIWTIWRSPYRGPVGPSDHRSSTASAREPDRVRGEGPTNGPIWRSRGGVGSPKRIYYSYILRCKCKEIYPAESKLILLHI